MFGYQVDGSDPDYTWFLVEYENGWLGSIFSKTIKTIPVKLNLEQDKKYWWVRNIQIELMESPYYGDKRNIKPGTQIIIQVYGEEIVSILVGYELSTETDDSTIFLVRLLRFKDGNYGWPGRPVISDFIPYSPKLDLKVNYRWVEGRDIIDVLDNPAKLEKYSFMLVE